MLLVSKRFCSSVSERNEPTEYDGIHRHASICFQVGPNASLWRMRVTCATFSVPAWNPTLNGFRGWPINSIWLWTEVTVQQPKIAWTWKRSRTVSISKSYVPLLFGRTLQFGIALLLCAAWTGRLPVQLSGYRQDGSIDAREIHSKSRVHRCSERCRKGGIPLQNIRSRWWDSRLLTKRTSREYEWHW